jgi:signal transduction histidine kinase
MLGSPGVPSASGRPPLPPALSRHVRWVKPGTDVLLLALTLALFLLPVEADIVVHAMFATLVVRAFAVDLDGTLVRLSVVTVAAVGYVAVHGLSPSEPLVELLEWPLLIILTVVIAVLASARDRAARVFAGLYHDATEELVTSQEEQRRQVAQDLHDGVGQGLGALMLTLDAVSERVAADEEAAAMTERARELTATVLEEVRGVASRINPALLDPAGMPGAIRELVTHAGRPVDFAMDPAIVPGLLDPAAETAFFRIVQEALSNAVRHSRASRVWVTLSRGDGFIRAEVGDDGVGFDTVAATGRGIGLTGMQQRASRVAGELGLVSRPGQGTLVSISMRHTPSAQPPGTASSRETAPMLTATES